MGLLWYRDIEQVISQGTSQFALLDLVLVETGKQGIAYDIFLEYRGMP